MVGPQNILSPSLYIKLDIIKQQFVKSLDKKAFVLSEAKLKE